MELIPVQLLIAVCFEGGVSEQDIDGRTPLFFACANNQFNACALLLDVSFEDVHVKDFRGDSPVHACACNNNLECLEVCNDVGSPSIIVV